MHASNADYREFAMKSSNQIIGKLCHVHHQQNNVIITRSLEITTIESILCRENNNLDVEYSLVNQSFYYCLRTRSFYAIHSMC